MKNIDVPGIALRVLIEGRGTCVAFGFAVRTKQAQNIDLDFRERRDCMPSPCWWLLGPRAIVTLVGVNAITAGFWTVLISGAVFVAAVFTYSLGEYTFDRE